MAYGSLYAHGFARVAACTTVTRLADPAANATAVFAAAQACDAEGVAVAVFPELALSGYAIEDLLLQDVLLDAVAAAVARLVAQSRNLRLLMLVGAPVRFRHRLYNCALAIQGGRLLGVVPKLYPPNYREFYERRHFASGRRHPRRGGRRSAASPRRSARDLLFAAADLPGFTVHAEICEDLWVADPTVVPGALAGATVLANLSASNITIGKSETRRLLCQSQSARCLAAYVYAAAGAGESTTDLAWDGQTSIYENGVLLAESERFPEGAQTVVRRRRSRPAAAGAHAAGHLRRQRAAQASPSFRTISSRWTRRSDVGLKRVVERFPFVPADPARLRRIVTRPTTSRSQGWCSGSRPRGEEGRHRRLRRPRFHPRADRRGARVRPAEAAARRTSWPSPCPASPPATQPRQRLGADARARHHRARDRHPPCRTADAGRPRPPFATGEPAYDVTFENVQAGLRTDYLFRLANQNDALVIGTGDLSELALGWCTYGVGDQMSHYNVNGGVPKTLIQHLIRWVIERGQFDAEVGTTLRAILATEISPELVPVGRGRSRRARRPRSALTRCRTSTCSTRCATGSGPPRSPSSRCGPGAMPELALGRRLPDERRRAYSLPRSASGWSVFLSRFFAFSQFKRSAMPNGPKVAAGGSLSPRGDWRAPSDGNAEAWLRDLQAARHAGEA